MSPSQSARACGVCGGNDFRDNPCGCTFVLSDFCNAMQVELEANAGKGGRRGINGSPGWVHGDPRFLLAEVFDHAAKLQLATTEHLRRERGMLPRPLPWGDRDTASLVREFAADVANMAMMLTDALGVLSEVDRAR
jgi:hypothetical protein